MELFSHGNSSGSVEDTPERELLYSLSLKNLGLPSPSTSSISKVRVIVRVRPFLPEEISQKNGSPIFCISVLSCDEVRVHLRDQETSLSECYKLDAFFGLDENSVSKIFQKEMRPLIPRIFEGFNATVFAHREWK